MSALSDREEGEIVDDYEYILSSDEENVRQRIQELEAKNYELEQIAQISGVYSDAYTGRNSYIPTDASSISSVEFDCPVRKSRKSRHKEVHKKKHNRRSRSRHRNRFKHYTLEDDEDHLTRLHAKITEELDTISVESTIQQKDEILSHASRAKLRFAVTGNVNGCKKSTALKERLLKENTILTNDLPKENTNKSEQINLTEEKSKAVERAEEDSLSADEQELRLIALKSAVLNKHMARKQRNAEVPYSPTDFEDLLANEESFVIDDNMELDMPDLAVGMDISPTISPAGTTPTSPVDMDIAQSDSDIEDAPYPPPPPPPISDNWQSYSNMEYPAAMHYGIYMPEMQYQQPPPPPPLPPPPPPAEAPTSNEPVDANAEEEEDDDEQALRALLLSKINQAKTQDTAKDENVQQDKDDCVENEPEVAQLENENTPTAVILKQAVLRLRQKTTTPTEMVEKAAECLTEKVEHRPKIIIRSVSDINRDFEKQHNMQKVAEVIEINSTVEEIITLSDSEDDGKECIPTKLQNKRALSDINCNVKERPNLILVPICNTIKQKVNIPNSEITKKRSQLKSESQVKRKNVATNRTNKRMKITPRKNKLIKNTATSAEETKKEANQVDKVVAEQPHCNDQSMENETKTNPKNNKLCADMENKSHSSNDSLTNISAKEDNCGKTKLPLKEIEKSTRTKPFVIKLKDVNALPTTNISKASTNNRLITTAPKIQVPKMIISLNNTESDESDCIEDQSVSLLSLDMSDMDFHNYDDNASPISLPMDSPANGTSRSVSPTTEAVDTNERLPTRTVVNDIFQQRLDDFLKTARTSIPATTNAEKTPKTASSSKEKQVVTTSTPMALRHLPVSAQQEYRSLILRMKKLEEEKLKKRSNAEAVEGSSAKSVPTVAFVSANKKTLIKKVLVKNATNTSPNAEAKTATTANNNSKFNYNKNTSNNNNNKIQDTKSVAKINALQTYEKSYEKLGGVIVLKLGKSLQQVEEARKAKINKFLYEEQVRQLKLQLRVAQQNLNQAQNTIQQVFPMISGTNQLITTLKRRRLKLYKAATVLGKTIKGDDYSLKNNVKEEVAKKSEKLALAIKEVNTIKANNITAIISQRTSATHTQAKTQEQGTMTDVTSLELEKKGEETASQQMEENVPVEKEKAVVNNESQEKEEGDEELRPYLTPLSDRDSNIATKLPSDAVLCPYDLSGNCQDTNCRHVHLNDVCI